MALPPVLSNALAAHGGEERWRALTALHATWTFHGMMFKLRLREGQLRKLQARIDTRAPRVEIEGFPPGARGTFLPEHVEVLDGSGAVTAAREAPRKAFDNPVTLAWWDPLEMLYFSGYVLWNYAQLPFLLTWPGLEVTDGGPSKVDGQTWNRINVTFPKDFPTHSPQQVFFFDDAGLLRRHDYHVGIMSSLARGARYIHEYVDVDGFKLPARIEIKLRLWGETYAPFPSLGFVDFADFRLER